jgi:hypothetical protein
MRSDRVIEWTGRSVASGDEALALDELDAERPHRRQLVEELFLSLFGREGIEEIGELNTMAHDAISELLFQVSTHKQAIIRVEK